MNSLERCRDPGEFRTNGDDARDQEELWDQVGRGMVAQLSSGSKSGYW
jgi:hypothetical protein